jgi:hypothetical protein
LLLSLSRKERRFAILTPADLDRTLPRRILLGAATALLVARPLVSGEDPGRLGSAEACSGQILNLLWLIVAAATAIWLGFSGRPIRICGLVAAGLMLVAASAAASAGFVDCYRHAAWLTACEWGMAPILFVLITVLTADLDPATDSAGGFLSALLASGISVAAFTLYQGLAAAARWRSPDLPLDTAPPVPPGDDFLGLGRAPSLSWTAHGTLERSDTLVGFLLLLLPAVVMFGRRDQSAKSRFALAAGAMFVAAIALASLDFITAEFPQRLRDGWVTAGGMAGEHPLLGVGPDNFERRAPVFQPAGAPERIAEPWNSYVELAATNGLPALVVLLSVIGVTIVQAFGRRGSGSPDAKSPQILPNVESNVAGGEKMPRWEFYLGGAIGLLLGLALRVNDLPGAEPSKAILQAGGAAVGRAGVWFLAFSLFENATWSAPGRARALGLGLALAALFGLVSGAMLRPVLMQTFWIVAALAIGGTSPGADNAWSRRLCWLVAVVVIGLAGGYLTSVCAPAARSASLARFAHMAGRDYDSREYNIEAAAPMEKEAKRQGTLEYMAGNIIKRLQDAKRADSRNTNLQLEEAAWFRAYWKLSPISKREPMLDQLKAARELDPFNPAPLVREMQLRLTFTTLDPRGFPKRDEEVERRVAKIRTENLDKAAELVPQIVERDPALEARLRYRLAEALFAFKEPERNEQARAEARRAWELDQNPQGPRWRLADDQRAQLRKWLDK